jgi:hypothetical protein
LDTTGIILGFSQRRGKCPSWNFRIDKFFSIGENNMDTEDVQMINDIEVYQKLSCG